MSEAFSETREAEADDAPDLETEVEEPETGDQVGDDEDEEKPRKQPDDWEKKAHNQAGRAARERSRRVAAEKKASDLESRLERLERTGGGGERDELLDLIGSLRDTEDDPVGDIASVKKALKLYAQRQAAETGQTAEQRALERQIEGLRGAMIDAETDFQADFPDYQDAAKYYRSQRLEELKDAGYAGRNLERKLADDLFGVVRMAIEAGLDPAERVYALAKKRGFKSGGKAADAKLDTLRRGTETGIRPQGRPAAGILSWADVAKLDGAARDKAWAKLREREKRAK